MRYSENGTIDAAYALIADMIAPATLDEAQPQSAMTVAAALMELGERDSWATVWWAYGALNHDLSDAALQSAMETLGDVVRPRLARAAALMLKAQTAYTLAIRSERPPATDEQRQLLEAAFELAPTWPELRVRLARACKESGDEAAAREHAARALEGLRIGPPADPFDAAISGWNLDPEYVRAEFEELGLISAAGGG